MQILNQQQQEIEQHAKLKAQQSEQWQRVVEILRTEKKNTALINELQNLLLKHTYFRLLFDFVSTVFSCFSFLTTLLEVLSYQDLKTTTEGDLILAVSVSEEETQQISDKSFLDAYNWNKYLKRKFNNYQDSTPTTIISQSNFLADYWTNENCQNIKQKDGFVYLVIREASFVSSIQKYEAHRNLIFNNICKCIPLVNQIKSTRMQDEIIKAVEVINFLEGTIINDPDLIKSSSPRLKYHQKNVHKSAIWFLIQGSGVIEKKLNENTKVSISILSECSLFGEEVLFSQKCQNTDSQQFEKQETNEFEGESEENEQNIQKREQFERFQLKLTSKVSHMYYIPSDKFQDIFPKAVVQFLYDHFCEKIKSRQDILKTKLLSLQTENKSEFQIKQGAGREEIQKKINFKKNLNEVSLFTDKMTQERQQLIESKTPYKQFIKINETLKKKQEILAYQQQRSSQRLVECQQDSQVQSAEKLQKLERSSSTSIIGKKANKQQIISYNTNEQSSIFMQGHSEKKIVDENSKLFLTNEADQKSSLTTRNYSSNQIHTGKKHLERKMHDIMNQGFDFGRENMKSDFKKDLSIKILQLKTGLLNTTVSVKHPSLIENQEKKALKKRQKIKSQSILQAMDDNTLNSLHYSFKTPITANKQIVVSQNQPVADKSDKKPSFYLTSREKSQENLQNFQFLNFSSRKSSFLNSLKGQSIDQDRSSVRGSEQISAINNTHLRRSTSFKRYSDVSLFGKSEDLIVGPFTVNQLHTQNSTTDLNEKNIQITSHLMLDKNNASDLNFLNKSQQGIFQLSKLQKIISNEQDEKESLDNSGEMETSCFGSAVKQYQKQQKEVQLTSKKSKSMHEMQDQNIQPLNYQSQVLQKQLEQIDKLQQQGEKISQSFKKQLVFDSRTLFQLDLSPLERNLQQEELQKSQSNDISLQQQNPINLQERGSLDYSYQAIQHIQQGYQIQHTQQGLSGSKQLLQRQDSGNATNVRRLLQKNQNTRNFDQSNQESIGLKQDVQKNSLPNASYSYHKSTINQISQSKKAQYNQCDEEGIFLRSDKSINSTVNQSQNILSAQNSIKSKIVSRPKSSIQTPRSDVYLQQDQNNFHYIGRNAQMQLNQMQKLLSNIDEKSKSEAKTTPKKINNLSSVTTQQSWQKSYEKINSQQINQITPRIKQQSIQAEISQDLLRQTQGAESKSNKLSDKNFMSTTDRSSYSSLLVSARNSSMVDINERSSFTHRQVLSSRDFSRGNQNQKVTKANTQNSQNHNLLKQCKFNIIEGSEWNSIENEQSLTKNYNFQPQNSENRNTNMNADTFGIKAANNNYSQIESNISKNQLQTVIHSNCNIQNQQIITNQNLPQNQLSRCVFNGASSITEKQGILNQKGTAPGNQDKSEKFNFNSFLRAKAKNHNIIKKGILALSKEQTPVSEVQQIKQINLAQGQGSSSSSSSLNTLMAGSLQNI